MVAGFQEPSALRSGRATARARKLRQMEIAFALAALVTLPALGSKAGLLGAIALAETA